MPTLIEINSNGGEAILFAARTPGDGKSRSAAVRKDTVVEAKINLDRVFKLAAALAESFERSIPANKKWKDASLELGLSFTETGTFHFVSASATESITLTFNYD